MRSIAHLTCLSMLALACTKKVPEEKHEIPETYPATAIQGEMESHHERAELLRALVIEGALGDAAKVAERLTAGFPGSVPEAWDAYWPPVKDYAWNAENAKSLEDAAVQIAHMGAACGACHRALVVTPPAPPDDTTGGMGTPKTRMRHHRWAADQMWYGLIASDDAAWSKGAAALGASSMWNGAGDMPAELGAKEARLRELATLAAAATDDDARVDAYGQIIGACAGCHASKAAAP